MATTSLTEQLIQGRVILERLAGVAVPAPLKPHVTTFKKAQDEYDAATRRAEEARAKRDAALEVVGNADDTFDEGIPDLANKIVGAGLGKRQNPFAAFSSYAPSKLTALPYAEEPKAITALAAELNKKSPPTDVAKALARSLKDAKALEGALAKLIQPQAAYQKALADRDALLPGWTKALRKLKRHAAALWYEEATTYQSIFAAPGAVQAPKKRASKKTAKKGGEAPKGPTP